MEPIEIYDIFGHAYPGCPNCGNPITDTHPDCCPICHTHLDWSDTHD